MEEEFSIKEKPQVSLCFLRVQYRSAYRIYIEGGWIKDLMRPGKVK